MQPSHLLPALLGILCCAGGGGGDGVAAPPPPPSSLASVRMSTNRLELAAGEQRTIELQGLAANGAAVPLTSVQWVAAPELSVTGTGGSVTLLGRQGGRGWVVARVGTLADSALVDVLPQPVAGNRVMLDLRQSLQQATTRDAAFALFGVVDHTPYRGARNSTGGWSFTTNADGKGLHAYRADWMVTPADQGLRVIHYFPDPKPREVYVQWKGRLGRFAADADGNGLPDSYAMWPQSNSCKRALFDRPDSRNRVDFTLSRAQPEGPKVEMGDHNYAVYGESQRWNPNAAVGGAPFTTTIRVRAASSAATEDGIFQLWVDGKMIMDQHDVPATASVFDRWSFPETCVLVPQPQSEYFWDLLVWAP